MSPKVLMLATILVAALAMSEAISLDEDVLDDGEEEELMSVLHNNTFVLVFWSGPQCRRCERVWSLGLATMLTELQMLDVHILRSDSKHTAKRFDIHFFPSISFFVLGQKQVFLGDMADPVSIWRYVADRMDVEHHVESVSRTKLGWLIRQRPHLLLLLDDDNEWASALAGIEQRLALPVVRARREDAAQFIQGKKERRSVKKQQREEKQEEQSEKDGLEETLSIESAPKIVFFNDTQPHLFPGELRDEDDINDILLWALSLKVGDSGFAPEALIPQLDSLQLCTAVLEAFETVLILSNSEESHQVTALLDDLDALGVIVVRHELLCGLRDGAALALVRENRLIAFTDEVWSPSKLLGWLKSSLAFDADPSLFISSRLRSLVSLVNVASNKLYGLALMATDKLVQFDCPSASKYVGYAIIALTHTCYILRNYEAPTHLQQ